MTASESVKLSDAPSVLSSHVRGVTGQIDLGSTSKYFKSESEIAFKNARLKKKKEDFHSKSELYVTVKMSLSILL